MMALLEQWMDRVLDRLFADDWLALKGLSNADGVCARAAQAGCARP